jgi:hypothetical protein
MMLEVTANTGEEAKQIAKEVGYDLEESYTPVPMPEGTFILRTPLDFKKDVPSDDRIKVWSDSKIEPFFAG